VELSINARQSFDWHFELGAKLARLRESGVLIIGGGNVVHNVRTIDWSTRDAGFDWAHRFDDAARALFSEHLHDVSSLQSQSDFDRAVPTPDHFIPLLHVAGLADGERCAAKVLIDGYAYGSLSMTSYTLDADHPEDRDGHPAAGLPDPSVVPAEGTRT
jgi:4,5-DOPA dioxygenase extradiol